MDEENNIVKSINYRTRIVNKKETLNDNRSKVVVIKTKNLTKYVHED